MTASTTNSDYLSEWTAQDDNMPEPPPQLQPQVFLPEQLPEDMLEEPRRIVEDGYLTENAADVDPPGSVALNREIDSPHLTGYAGMEAPDPATANEDAADEAPNDSWTKAELQAYADEQGIEGVDMNSQNKAEMLEAIG